MSKKHAEHNEDLCNHLFTKTGFNDWVITTAFYSSLHFVRSKIFPLTLNKIVYDNFEQYYATIKSSPKPSPHNQLALLVLSKIPQINPEYKFLLDACWSSRYHNYIVPDKLAEKAKKYLDKIKSHC